MKRKFLFAIVAFTASLAAMADDDTRIEISEIVATSNTSEIPVYGANIIQPTVTVIQGLPARFGIDSGNGWWHKKVDNEWRDVRSGSFTSGTWRFVCQVRIDGEGGKTHKFAKTVTTTVDGTIWGVDDNPSIFDTFCWTWVSSPEFVIPEPVDLYFHYWKDFDIDVNYVDRPIKSYTVAENAEGGTKPYTFSKTSGPEWIVVAADGTVSGTPTTIGANEKLVIRVTDATGSWKQIEIPVSNTYANPANRTDIAEVEATSDIATIPIYGADIRKPKVTVTKGQPARFGIDDGNGWWARLDGNEWHDVRKGTFTPGTWHFVCQVRIDGEGGKTHKFAKTVTTTVDGTIWGVDNNPSIFDTFCWTWVSSPDYVISEDAGIISTSSSPQLSSPRTIYNLSGQRVGNDYKGIVIDKGRKIVR